MNTKTMEGLIGARTNMNLLNTPFRVYKEARLKNDTAMMERAMGYMGACHQAAYEYKEEADEGMKKDAEETRKIAEEQREEAIRKRREEREKLEERIEESREENKENRENREADTVEISGEGRALLKENAAAGSNASDSNSLNGSDLDSADLVGAVSTLVTADTGKEPVIYTKEGVVSRSGQTAGISVSV